MAMHGTYDLILQKANWSLLVVLIHLSVEYISMVNQYIGSTKLNILVYFCFVIQVLLISQTRSENSMESLIISWPFLVNIQMRWLHCTLIKVIAYQHCCMAVKSGTWTTAVCRKSQSHGTTASDVFFSCCWRESVKLLQYFCHTLPIPFLLHQRKLLFWKKLYCSESVVLQSFSRRMHQAFVAVGSLYNVLSPKLSNNSIRELICNSFTMSVNLWADFIISVLFCFLNFCIAVSCCITMSGCRMA